MWGVVSWLVSNGVISPSLHLYICPPHSAAFNDTLANDVLLFNVTAAIATLQELSDTFAAIPDASLVTATDEIVAQLRDIDENQLPAIEMSVDLLEDQVDRLSDHIDGVVVSLHSAYMYMHCMCLSGWDTCFALPCQLV